jgi:hypothetical protein
MIGKDSSEACAIACQNCAVYSVFPSGRRHTVKPLGLTGSVQGAVSKNTEDVRHQYAVPHAAATYKHTVHAVA